MTAPRPPHDADHGRRPAGDGEGRGEADDRDGARSAAGDEPTGSGRDLRTGVPVFTVALLFIATFVAGYLFIGSSVLVIGLALLVLLRFGRDPGRPLALAALLLLVVAGAATILQGYPPEPALNYAVRRSIAAESGAIVGVFLVLATLIFAVTERAPDPVSGRFRRRAADAARRAVGAIRPHLAVATVLGALALVAVAVRLLLAPVPLAAGYEPLLRNLRFGNGYSLQLPSGFGATAAHAPLATNLVAFLPLSARSLLLLASLGTLGATAVLARRWGGTAAAVVALAVGAVLPSLWSLQLPDQLAALCLTIGLLYDDPTRRTRRRSIAAGVAVGLAVLARPDVVVAAAALLFWSARGGRPGGRSHRLAFGSAVALTLVPWVGFVRESFGFPWLAESVAALLNEPGGSARFGGPIGLVVGALAAAVTVGLVARRLPRAARYPAVVLPLLALVLVATSPDVRDPLTWSGPVVAAALGCLGAGALPGPVRRRLTLGPTIDATEEPTPDLADDRAIDRAADRTAG